MLHNIYQLVTNCGKLGRSSKGEFERYQRDNQNILKEYNKNENQ